MCLVTLYNFCVKLFLRRIKRHKIKNVYWSSSTEPVILVRFEWNLNYLNSFWKSIQIPNLMKIVQCALSCSMRTDGQTDMTEVIFGFSQFCNTNEKGRRVNVKKHTRKRRFTSTETFILLLPPPGTLVVSWRITTLRRRNALFANGWRWHALVPY